MSGERPPDEPPEQPHVYIHPEVIEAHILSGTPIPLGTLKLLLALKLLDLPE